MYNVNLLPGKNTFSFTDIFNEFNYNTDENFDFDLFITDGFHLVQAGRSEPILNYEDLKTDKLIIFNYDMCNPLSEELFPSILKFLDGKNIKCLVITLHHILDDKDLPKEFGYVSFDFFTFETVENYQQFNEIFNIWKYTVQFLRPKKFLCYNNTPKPHRIKLKDFLVKKGYVDDGWFSFDAFSEGGINLDCISGYGSLFDKLNLGLYLTSYFSIIPKALYENSDGIPNVYLANKIWMAMSGLHPFFVLAQPKTLSYLRSVGFKTFEDFWDESYDDELDDEIRFRRFFDSINEFLGNSNKDIHRKLFGKKWDGDIHTAEWMKLYKILKHNYYHLPIYSKNQKQKVIDKITNFVKE